jgi:hypothetical protein
MRFKKFKKNFKKGVDKSEKVLYYMQADSLNGNASKERQA